MRKERLAAYPAGAHRYEGEEASACLDVERVRPVRSVREGTMHDDGCGQCHRGRFEDGWPYSGLAEA